MASFSCVSCILLVFVLLQLCSSSVGVDYEVQHIKAGSTSQCCGLDVINATTTGCCATSSFRLKDQYCCASKIVVGGASVNKTTCCGDKAYDPKKKACCASVLDDKYPQANITCCGNQTIPLGSAKSCCNNQLVYSPNKNETCCGSTVINLKKQSCCKSLVIDTPFVTSYNCCSVTGGKKAYFFDPILQLCCNGKVRNNHIGAEKCCGTDTYDPSVQGCCKDSVYTNATTGCCSFSKTYNRRKEKCCGDESVPIDEECCGDLSYNPKKEVCCKSEVLEKPSKGRIGQCCEGDDSSRLFDNTTQTCCTDGRVLSGGGSKLNCCPAKDGKSSYDPKTHSCCGTSVISNSTSICCGLDNPDTAQDYKLDTNKMCCENKYRDKSGGSNPFCCSDKLYFRTLPLSNWQCCGDKAYNTQIDICCDGVISTKIVGAGVDCCGEKPYDSTKSICCDTDTTLSPKLYTRPAGSQAVVKCCGNKLMTNSTVQLCCKEA